MRRSTLLIAAVVVASAAGHARAEFNGTTENPFDRGTSDTFSITLGAFIARFDSEARLDSDDLGQGTTINLEDRTGLDKNATDIRLDGYWRFARKHRLTFGGAIIARSASRTLDESLQWGDTVFDVDTDVQTKLSNNFFKVAYKYSIVRNTRVDAGVSAGLSTFILKAEIAGEASIASGGSVEGGEFERETKNVVAPVPVLGGHCEVRIVDHVFFSASAEYFKITVSDIEGSLSDVRGDFNWYPFKHFGFGVGYNRISLDYEDSGDTTFDFTYTFDGALVYATYVF